MGHNKWGEKKTFKIKKAAAQHIRYHGFGNGTTRGGATSERRILSGLVSFFHVVYSLDYV